MQVHSPTGILICLVLFLSGLHAFEEGDELPRTKRATRRDGDMNRLISFGNCGQLYVEEIQASVWKDGEKEGYHALFTGNNLKPTHINQTCSGKIVSLYFSIDDAKRQTLEIELVFNINPNHYWELVTGIPLKGKISSEVITHFGPSGQEVFYLTANEVTSSVDHSFSCMDLELTNVRKPKQEYTLRLNLKRFQVQPFVLDPKMKQIFADSFDCSTWFTIPLWVGFLVTLFFTAILAFGVYALLDIKTPDRFENPKGKTITVTATD